MNFLVSLPKQLALFSEFKHCICKRRRYLLKKAIFASVSLPYDQFLSILTDLSKPRDCSEALAWD